MGVLFKRNATVTFGTPGDHIASVFPLITETQSDFYQTDVPFDKVISGLRIAFEIEKNSDSSTNKAKIEIYNMSESSRAILQKGGDLIVVLEVGYGDELGMVFFGDIVRSYSFKDGAEWVTEIIAEDGKKALENALINKTFGPGIDYDRIVDELLGQIKNTGAVVKGVYNEVKSFLRSKRTQNGVTLIGNAREELIKILKSFNLEFSVQDGETSIVEPGKPRYGMAYLFSEGTGLVGSPIVRERKNKPILQVRSKIVSARIKPGSLIRVESREFKGNYVVRNVKYKGDTHASSWDMLMEVVESA